MEIYILVTILGWNSKKITIVKINSNNSINMHINHRDAIHKISFYKFVWSWINSMHWRPSRQFIYNQNFLRLRRLQLGVENFSKFQNFDMQPENCNSKPGKKSKINFRQLQFNHYYFPMSFISYKSTFSSFCNFKICFRFMSFDF